MTIRTYRTSNRYHYVVETGMPTDAVRVGAGDTLDAARETHATPLQSVGPDSGALAGLREAIRLDCVGTAESVDAIFDDCEEI